MKRNKKDKASGEEMSYGSTLPDGRIIVKGYDKPDKNFVEGHDRGRYE